RQPAVAADAEGADRRRDHRCLGGARVLRAAAGVAQAAERRPFLRLAGAGAGWERLTRRRGARRRPSRKPAPFPPASRPRGPMSRLLLALCLAACAAPSPAAGPARVDGERSRTAPPAKLAWRDPAF